MLGMPLDDAVQRLPDRIPLSEASFFAIVIAIQSRTGGSLSEALGNLSRVLRERKKMEAKIKAMSGEAKASAGIIGALPVVVAGLLYATSPEYIGLLFTTQTGHIVMAACGLLMLGGTLMMRKMSPESVAQVQRGMAERPDSVPDLKTINVPTLIVTGDEDVLTGPPEAELMRQNIPSSKLKVIRRAGHYSPWEQPGEAGQLLRQFLDSVYGA